MYVQNSSFKKKWLIFCFLIVSIAIIGAIILSFKTNKKPVAITSKKPFVLYPGAEYIPDKLIVNFQEGKKPDDKETWKKLQKLGVIHSKKLFTSDDPLLRNFYVLELKKGTDLRKTGESINSLEEVVATEGDSIAKALTAPNDPSYSQQWGYKKIAMEQAWDKTKGSKSVIAAVLDTGVDYRHPDLPSDIIKGPNYTSGDNDPIDRFGHGTHVSGTIGALTNNGAGVSGVNWEVHLMIVKVLGDNGSGGASGIAQGIVWAADHGARVISMSLGGPGGCASLYQNAMDHAVSKGAVVAVAAGNDGKDGSGTTPANCNGIITVGATDSNDRRASFSNYGSVVEIGAPGVGILSTTPNGQYKSESGTSMATPHVAGAAALLLSKNSNLTPQQVIECLVKNGDPITTDQPIGGKRLNMAKTLDDPACGGGPASTNSPSPTAGTNPTITTGPSVTSSPAITATATPVPPTPTRAPRIVVRFRCFVFRDENDNGKLDAGEQGVSDAEFTVFPKRKYSPTATTSSDGYCYLILIPGEYRIIIRIAGKIAALSDPFEISDAQDEQTLSIGIKDEQNVPVEPTSSPSGSSYECRQPSISRSGKSLQLVNLQCTAK